ncbi:hypothetical protein BGZ65_006100 [Modicella reniformis]|uniref:GPI inositol-deacylase n=1 Tax=Modicella reniformis TaxID=1440133 RepID=A0A9P6JHB7_9FUNG|nr:hypothetical protein BGZ65_006100 [Modicella reniformis]
MLMSTTSFLASQLRSSISAAVHSTSALVTSIRTSLGLVAKDSTSSPSSSASRTSSSSAYNREVEENQIPLQHEQYPLLQPWRGFHRRIKSYAHSTVIPVASSYNAPRQPIVLCHGLFGFDKIGPDAIPHLQIHYWSGIHKALTRLGAKVIVAKVPRTGSIKERAEDLHKILSTTMQDTPVNFVAHSMGGLDCRYLISHIHNRNYEVQSLTTLSTPHRGSPVMDWFRDNIGVGHLLQSEEEAMQKLGEAAKSSRAAVLEVTEAFHTMLENAAGRVISSTNRAAPHAAFVSPLLNRLIPFLDTPAYANLTTTYCNEVFNPNTPDDPRVSYFSYGGAVPQIPLWAPLGFPWEVIKAKDGDNDGLVSTKSARWGQYVETVEADHWDLNNRWRLKIGYDQKPFDAIELYMKLATHLYKHGF